MTIQANQGFGVSVFGAVSGGGGGSTSPGGSSGQVQYNNGGAFGGLSQLTFSGGKINVVSAPFGLSGNISSAAWTTSGIRYANSAATLTDTSSTGTVATAYTDLFGGNTIAASSATTFTNYYTSWFNAPTAGTNVTFTARWAMGLGGPLDIQAGTVTTNTTPALNLTQTWNASGAGFTAIKLNVTNTASSNASLLCDLQIGGATFFSINKFAQTNFYTSTGTVVATVGSTTAEAIRAASNAQIGFSSNTSANIAGLDTILTRAAAATLQLGAADTTGTTAPTAQLLRVQSWSSSTNNNQLGADFTIQGSRGTGTGAGGSIIFQVAPASGSSNGVQNAYSTALTINSTGVLTAAGNSNGKAVQLGGNGGTAIGAVGGDARFDGPGGGNTYLFGDGSGAVFTAGTANSIARIGSSGIFIRSDAYFGFAPGNDVGSGDTRLYRDTTSTLALRNGNSTGAAQRFNVYNTYTSSTNYETFKIDWITTANTCLIGTEKGSGGGTARALALQTDGTTRLTIAATGDATFANNVVLNSAGSLDIDGAQAAFTACGTGYGAYLSVARFSALYGAQINLARSRAATVGTRTALQSGDIIGEYTFYAAGGFGYLKTASIGAYVEGTVDSITAPGRLSFFTTSNSAVVTERFRIDNAGVGIFASAGQLAWNSASFTSGSVATPDLYLSRSAAGVIQIEGASSAGGSVKYNAYTYSTLPTGAAGIVAYISDASNASPAFGDSVTSGGGSTKVLCWYNGANWTVIGK